MCKNYRISTLLWVFLSIRNIAAFSPISLQTSLIQTHILSGTSSSLKDPSNHASDSRHLRTKVKLNNVRQLNVVEVEQTANDHPDKLELPMKYGAATAAISTPLLSLALNFGKKYATLLDTSPILTKSITAGIIFGLSDYTAQQIESSSSDGNRHRKNWTRIITASLVGLLYFGPAAHAWYGMIFKLLPGTNLLSTLQKAALGQAIFGPCFTSIFFASSLWQAGNFTLKNWVQKIKSDLPGAWRAGIGFWPLVDLISYSMIAPQWIPLFVNFCSFVWTIYLSMVANKTSGKGA